MAWQLQGAKQRFSALIRRAQSEGPQIVTRHGDVVAVVLSAEEYRRLTALAQGFKDFLLSGPDLSLLDLDHPREPAREVEL